jgi:hypothetical protein
MSGTSTTTHTPRPRPESLEHRSRPLLNYSQERKAFYGKKEHRGEENQTKVSTEKKKCTLWRGYFWVLRAVIL